MWPRPGPRLAPPASRGTAGGRRAAGLQSEPAARPPVSHYIGHSPCDLEHPPAPPSGTASGWRAQAPPAQACPPGACLAPPLAIEVRRCVRQAARRCSEGRRSQALGPCCRRPCGRSQALGQRRRPPGAGPAACPATAGGSGWRRLAAASASGAAAAALQGLLGSDQSSIHHAAAVMGASPKAGIATAPDAAFVSCGCRRLWSNLRLPSIGLRPFPNRPFQAEFAAIICVQA